MVAKRRGKKLNTTLFDRYYLQNCNHHTKLQPSHKITAIRFRKTAIKPNGNKLMFQAIFIFSDWILI